MHQTLPLRRCKTTDLKYNSISAIFGGLLKINLYIFDCCAQLSTRFFKRRKPQSSTSTFDDFPEYATSILFKLKKNAHFLILN